MDLEHIAVAARGMTFDGVAAGPTDGPPVLLLHGFPRTARLWRHQVAALGREGRRAVAIDQRGCSPGARPTVDAAYRMPELVGDVVGVADALGHDRFDVVAHDWGGMVAWHLAATRPDRVRRMAVLSTPHPSAYGRALSTLDQRRRSAYLPVFRSSVASRLLAAGDGAGLRLLLSASGLPGRLAGPVVERARRDPGWLPAALAWYRANDLTTLRVAGEVAVPLLYVWGATDVALGPRAAYWTGDHVRGPYRFVALPGVGHWLPELAADAVSRLVVEHLATD